MVWKAPLRVFTHNLKGSSSSMPRVKLHLARKFSIFWNLDFCYPILVPLHRLELCSSAPEADALSTELQGRATKFYHIIRAERSAVFSGTQSKRTASVLPHFIGDCFPQARNDRIML